MGKKFHIDINGKPVKCNAGRYLSCDRQKFICKEMRLI